MLRRFPTADIPESEEELSDWLINLYHEKVSCYYSLPTSLPPFSLSLPLPHSLPLSLILPSFSLPLPLSLPLSLSPYLSLPLPLPLPLPLSLYPYLSLPLPLSLPLHLSLYPSLSLPLPTYNTSLPPSSLSLYQLQFDFIVCLHPSFPPFFSLTSPSLSLPSSTYPFSQSLRHPLMIIHIRTSTHTYIHTHTHQDELVDHHVKHKKFPEPLHKIILSRSYVLDLIVFVWISLLGIPAFFTALYLAWVGAWLTLGVIVTAIFVGEFIYNVT